MVLRRLTVTADRPVFGSVLDILPHGSSDVVAHHTDFDERGRERVYTIDLRDTEDLDVTRSLRQIRRIKGVSACRSLTTTAPRS
jgi:hypothetical protein